MSAAGSGADNSSLGGWFRKCFGRGRAAREQLKAELRRDTFLARLKPEHFDMVFQHVELIQAAQDQVIIREGDEADFFYLLLEGSVRVTRQSPAADEPIVLAELGPGSGFGEEAIISMGVRNATITMNSPGRLARLPDDIFVQYIQSALVTWYSHAEALRRIAKGAVWVDVREPLETREYPGQLQGSLTIPLSQIRDRLEELKTDTLYICYDERGRRSATAAFLLTQRGYQAAVLQGGLRSLRI
jgi:CRP-like cAMP-binding protein